MAAKSQSPQNIDSKVVEQVEKARWRQFSAAYKLKILEVPPVVSCTLRLAGARPGFLPPKVAPIGLSQLGPR
jgi:hypothetical protein